MSDKEIGKNTYLIDYIRKYLGRGGFYLSSRDLNLFYRTGDSVAVAILRVLYPDRKLDSDLIRSIVVAVQSSLEYPEGISNEYDRVPGVSVCLLEVLMHRAELEEDRRFIEAAIGKIRGDQSSRSG